MMITLKNALEAALVDIRSLRNTGFDPAGSLIAEDRLNRALWCLTKTPTDAISLSMIGCEACIDCAHQADDAEQFSSAELFRGIVRTLSPLIARKAV